MGTFEFSSQEQVRRDWINNAYEFDELASQIGQESAPADMQRAASVEFHAGNLLGDVLVGGRPFPEPAQDSDPLSGLRERAEQLADLSAELIRGNPNG